MAPHPAAAPHTLAGMSKVQIVHVPEQDRWEAAQGEGSDARTVGFLSYELGEDLIDLQHTVVDTRQRGHGIGGQLVEAALQHARAEGLSVRPTCPFIPSYLADHPEHADLVEGAATGAATTTPEGQDG